jgi:soluble lytic murein transglycosylase-like protein
VSALAIEPTAVQSGPIDAANASRRVQQLQTLVAQAASGSTASFAAALNAASGASGTGAQGEPSIEAGAQGSALARTTTAAPPPAGLTPAALATENVAAAPSQMPAAPGVTSSASTSSTPPVAAEDLPSSAYDNEIAQAATRNGIEPALLHGLIQQESGFDPNARSSSGALGLTQLMPGTASSLGVSDPLDPTQSIEGGARYLGEMLAKFGGNTADALAAYNAGPGAVSRYGGVPPYRETQEYVNKVLGYTAAYSRTLPASNAGASVTPASSAPGGSIA